MGAGGGPGQAPLLVSAVLLPLDQGHQATLAPFPLCCSGPSRIANGSPHCSVRFRGPNTPMSSTVELLGVQAPPALGVSSTPAPPHAWKCFQVSEFYFIETLACPDYGAQGLDHPSVPASSRTPFVSSLLPLPLPWGPPTLLSVRLCEEPPVLVGSWETLREVVDGLGDPIRAR